MNHSDDLREELKNSPLLGSLDKKEAHEIPEGYFEQLSANLQDRLEDEAMLENAPGIQRAGKKNVFQVPGDYFEYLPQKVMSSLPAETKVRSMRRWLRPHYSWAVAAAVIFLLVLAFLSGGKKDSPVEEELAFDSELKQEEIYEALELAGVDSYDLMAAINEQNQVSSDDSQEKNSYSDLEEELLNKLEMGELEELIIDM